MSHSALDPELLQKRVEELEEAALRQEVRRVLAATFAVRGKINLFDFASLEAVASDRRSSELWTSAEPHVTRIWTSVTELLETLSDLQAYGLDSDDDTSDDGLPDDSTGDDSAVDDDPADPDTSFTEDDGRLGGSARRARGAPSASEDEFDLFSSPKPKVPPSVEARLRDTAEAMRFVFQSEVGSLRGRLPAIRNIPDGWELVGALQDHLAKLNGATDAILMSLLACLPEHSGSGDRQDKGTSLIAARELRSRIFELRDKITEVEAGLKSAPASTWQEPLRRAEGLLDHFMFGPGFAWMRANDKRSFLKARASLTEVLALWSPIRAEPARRVIDNLARYLDALQVINQREVLVQADRAALEVVVDNLSRVATLSGQDRSRAIATGLASLADAQGRDVELDALMGQTLSPGAPVPLEQILARCRAVLASMGARGGSGWA